LLVWWYSGAIGHFLGLPGVDSAHYPYDMAHYTQFRVHWPLQLLLPIGGILMLIGPLLFVIDLFRRKAKKANG
jgi:hypothetical protein